MKPRVSHQKTAALTLVEVFVVIVVLFVLAALLLPALSRPHKDTWRSLCVNNLKQIDLSYRFWADDHNGKYPFEISVTDGGTMELNNALANFLVISNNLGTPKLLICPSDTDRVAATDFTTGFSAKNTSYFVGLDAGTNHPKTFVSGDDNFAISGIPVKSGLLEFSSNAPIAWTAARHGGSYQPNLWTPMKSYILGNIGLADGSVQITSPQLLQQAVQNTGVATNRLAIP